jgi:ABC-type transport system involved in cytochrome bd biosynthesis fused ATPase/permease subunit
MNHRHSLRELHRTSKPSSGIVFVSVCSATVGGLAQLLLMASLGYLLAWSAARPALSAIAGILTVVELLAFFRAPLRYFDRLRSHGVAFAALRSWRVWLFERLIPLSPGGLGATKTGDVLTAAMSDVDGLGDLYIRALLPLAGSIIPFCAAVVLIGLLNIALAIVAVLIAIAALLLINAETSRAAAWSTELANLQGERAGVLLDALQGAATLSSANGWGRPLGAALVLEDHCNQLTKRLTASSARRALLGQALSGAMVIVATAAVLHAPAANDPRLLVALITMSIALGELVGGAAGAVASLEGVRSSWSRLQALSSRNHAIVSGEKPLPASPLSADANDLTLTYGGASTPAFAHLSFTIPAGQHTVITGPSGSGKSSVLVCLLGLWPRDEGDLQLSGIDFDELNHDEVRAAVGTHLSNSALFSGTIRSNLAVTGATEEAMTGALRAVGLDEQSFLDRPLFEGGRGLSGGEQLRVSIVRALLHGKQAVFIDEPTAQLDETSAALVLAAISALSRDKTVVTVAHERGMLHVDAEISLSVRRSSV